MTPRQNPAFRIAGLFLPIIIPSWRFFDVIAPSPRIEICTLSKANVATTNWQIFKPKPEHLTFSQMLKRLFFNPHGNEDLYLVSLAERLAGGDCAHSEQEIVSLIRPAHPHDDKNSHFQFRLVFITRESDELQKHILWTSAPHTFKNHEAL